MASFRQADIVLYQGDDWAGEVTVFNQDGTDADLTGYTARAQIRRGPADESRWVVAELLCAVVVPNLISISLTRDQTRLMKESAYRWDLQIVSPVQVTTTLLAGRVTVTREVTRELVVPPIGTVPPFAALTARDVMAEEALRRDVQEEYLIEEEERWR